MKHFSIFLSTILCTLVLSASLQSCNSDHDDGAGSTYFYRNIREITSLRDSVYYFNDDHSFKYPLVDTLRNNVMEEIKTLKFNTNQLWEVSYSSATKTTVIRTNTNKALADYDDMVGTIRQIQTGIDAKDPETIGKGVFSFTLIYEAGYWADNRTDTVVISYNHPQ